MGQNCFVVINRLGKYKQSDIIKCALLTRDRLFLLHNRIPHVTLLHANMQLVYIQINYTATLLFLQMAILFIFLTSFLRLSIFNSGSKGYYHC